MKDVQLRAKTEVFVTMKADPSVRLFVYGTLLPGCSNYWQIERRVRDARPGKVNGVLIDLGAFPALIPGDGLVEGMVFDVDRVALRIADRIEGYRPSGGDWLYLRKKVVVNLDSGSQEPAWAYFFADVDRISHLPKLAVRQVAGTPVHSWRIEG